MAAVHELSLVLASHSDCHKIISEAWKGVYQDADEVLHHRLLNERLTARVNGCKLIKRSCLSSDPLLTETTISGSPLVTDRSNAAAR